MKVYFYLIIFLLKGLILQAQQPLMTGDKMPDWKFQTLMNNLSPTVKISDYKGMVIMLVFWNTGCTSNYNILPELADLQAKLKKSLKIILVSEGETEKINAFFAKRKSLKDLGLPMVERDLRFSEMLPHSAVPHVILIAKDGKITALNDPSYATFETIQLLVLGKSINIPEPVVGRIIDPKKTLGSNGFINDTTLMFSSTLTTSFAGISGQMGFKKLDKARRKVYIINNTMLGMYSFAYEARMNIISSDFSERIIFNENGKQKNKENIKKIMGDSPKYCYELILPEKKVTNNSGLLAYMQKDLDSYFSLNSRIEKRKTKCYVLRKGFATCNSDNAETYTQNWVNKIEFNNEQIISIASVLQDLSLLSYPLLSEESSNDCFTLTLNKQYSNFQSLQSDLQKGGLSINEEEKEINFLIIDKL